MNLSNFTIGNYGIIDISIRDLFRIFLYNATRITSQDNNMDYSIFAYRFDYGPPVDVDINFCTSMKQIYKKVK